MIDEERDAVELGDGVRNQKQVLTRRPKTDLPLWTHSANTHPPALLMGIRLMGPVTLDTTSEMACSPNSAA